MTQTNPQKKPSRTLTARATGFTLIEILLVMAIIAVLSAIAYPFYNGYINKAKVTVGISTLETVRKTLEDYHGETGFYPASIDMATGKDGLGRTVLPTTLLAEFKSNLFSLDSYVVTTDDYTLTATAIDAKHTPLVLTPGQIITQGP